VWFSSGWSNATCSAFRKALAALMSEQHSGAPLSSEVLAILRFWQVQLCNDLRSCTTLISTVLQDLYDSHRQTMIAIIAVKIINVDIFDDHYQYDDDDQDYHRRRRPY